MWRWADVKMSRCERRCERRYEERWADERRCERRYEDEQMWRWADVREDVKMSRCERRCEDEQMWRWVDVKMRRCEDEKVRYRPPLLEEPCAQTLSGKSKTIRVLDHVQVLIHEGNPFIRPRLAQSGMSEAYCEQNWTWKVPWAMSHSSRKLLYQSTNELAP